jgi:hypothetical protein
MTVGRPDLRDLSEISKASARVGNTIELGCRQSWRPISTRIWRAPAVWPALT